MSVLGSKVKITVPSTSDATDSEGKSYKIYTIVIKGPNGFEKTCQKRFNEFREFDKSWQKVYGSLHETYRLPTAKVYKNVLKSEDELLNERRVGLEAYLNGLGSVVALQPLVCQFLEAPMSLFDGDKIKSSASDGKDATLRAPLNIKEAVTTMDHLRHGNNDDAARRAQADKEAFLRQNAALIEQLMPGRQLVLEKQSASFSQGLVKAVKAKASGIAGKEGADKGTAAASAKPTCMIRQDYTPSGEENVLTVKKGEIITILTEDDEHWWYGETAKGEMGFFPAALAEKIITFSGPRQKLILGRCVLGYTPDADEEGVLTLIEGARLTVLNQDSADWWTGRLEDGREGFFPPQCFKADATLQQEDLEGVVEPSDVKAAVQQAAKGISCQKYAFSLNGFPKPVDLFLRPLADSASHLGCLFYSEPGKRDMTPKRCIAVNSIVEIRLGKQTEAFQRAVAQDADLYRSFSIVYHLGGGTVRSLDLEALEPGTRGGFIGTIVAFAKSAKTPKNIVVKPQADLSGLEPPSPNQEGLTGIEKAQAAYRWARKKTSTLADQAYTKGKALKQ